MMTNNNIPQGYKQTELGIIPEDWEYSPSQKYLKEISMGPFGSDIKVENFVGFGIPVLNGANLQSYRLIDRFENYVISQKAAALKKAVANKGDIIITHRGTLGQVTYIPKSAKFDRYVISQSQFRVRFNECIDSEFIVRYLLSPIGQGCLLEFKGHTGVPALAQPTTNFRNLPLLIPPIAEQRAIAEALSDVDGLIAALDKKIAKKRLLKQGAMQQLLTGKKRLPGFSDEWVEKKLGDIGVLFNGYAFKSETYNKAGKYNIITIANVQNGKLTINDCNRILSIPSDIQEHQKLKKNDILISMTGNVGRACLVNASDCLLNQRVGLFVIRDTQNCDKHFIFTIINDGKFENAMIESGQGAAQANIGKKDIEGFTFLLPTNIKEQQAIATILSDMDKEIADLEAQRDKYRLLKSGMMQKLLTGQIRLK